VRDEQPHAIILRNGATTERPPFGGRFFGGAMYFLDRKGVLPAYQSVFFAIHKYAGKELFVNTDASESFSVKKVYISACSKQVLNGVADLLECLCPRWAYMLNGG